MNDDTLTLEKMEALMRDLAPLPEPEWATMLREAHAVEVRVTPLLPDTGQAFVLDPNKSSLAPPSGTLPVLLLCRPEHEAVARDALRALGITPVNGEPR